MTLTPDDRWVTQSVRAYARLVAAAYPPDFRRRYEAEMQRVFEDRCRDVIRRRRYADLARLWVGTLQDLVVNGALERRSRRRRLAARRPAAPPSPTSGAPMRSVLKDITIAFRGLRRNPAFAVVAVLTLGLGIGANTAIFSVVRGVLLRPLPYAEADRLALIWGEMRNRNVQHWPFSPPDLLDVREATLFDAIGGVVTFAQSLTGEGDPERVMVGGVTDNFLELLGVQPMLGRAFTPEDATPFDPNAAPNASPPPNAVVLSHGLWQRRFGGDREVIGRSVQLAGGAAVVVGVMPEGFRLLMPPTAALASQVDLWSALRIDFETAPRGNVFLRVAGRLKPGVTIPQAQAELDAIASRLRQEHPISNDIGFYLRAVPWQEDLTAHVRPVMLALLGAVGFVLLIACVNVANLLLVRSTARGREIAVRAALGGSRTQIVRQVLTESVVLALLGGGVGLALAQGGTRALIALEPGNIPRLDLVTIDPLVLLFTAGVCLTAAVIFGTIPALHAVGTRSADALRARSNAGGSVLQRRVRNGMVVIEVALSVVLMIGAGLMLRTFVELQRVEPGFDPDGVLTFEVPIPFQRFQSAEARAGLQQRLKLQLEALPGVEHVGGIFPLPLSDEAFNGRYGTEAALEDQRHFRQADYRAVLPGYFEAVRAELLAGRTFTEADNADSLPLVIIDDVLARLTWPGAAAVGKRLLVRPLGPDPIWVEVVGVVAHQRHPTLQAEGRETIYYPERFLGSFGNLIWTVRAAGDPLALARGIRSEVAALDPLLPVSSLRPLAAYLSDARAPTRFALLMIAVFGVSALFLASVGLYGVLAYVVRQRTAEIGVRMAFGAPTANILWQIVRQGLVLALVGVGVGVGAALGLTRVMTSLLVGVTPTDPTTFLAVAGLFVAVAAGASSLPAQRATRVDPVIALREE